MRMVLKFVKKNRLGGMVLFRGLEWGLAEGGERGGYAFLIS